MASNLQISSCSYHRSDSGPFTYIGGPDGDDGDYGTTYGGRYGGYSSSSTSSGGSSDDDREYGGSNRDYGGGGGGGSDSAKDYGAYESSLHYRSAPTERSAVEQAVRSEDLSKLLVPDATAREKEKTTALSVKPSRFPSFGGFDVSPPSTFKFN